MQQYFLLGFLVWFISSVRIKFFCFVISSDQLLILFFVYHLFWNSTPIFFGWMPVGATVSNVTTCTINNLDVKIVNVFKISSD